MPDVLGGKARRVSVSPVVWSYILGCVTKSMAHEQRAEAKARQMATDAAIARHLAESVSDDYLRIVP